MQTLYEVNHPHYRIRPRGESREGLRPEDCILPKGIVPEFTEKKHFSTAGRKIHLRRENDQIHLPTAIQTIRRSELIPERAEVAVNLGRLSLREALSAEFEYQTNESPAKIECATDPEQNDRRNLQVSHSNSSAHAVVTRKNRRIVSNSSDSATVTM